MFVPKNEVQEIVVQRFRLQHKEFLAQRICQLVQQWNSCLNATGNSCHCWGTLPVNNLEEASVVHASCLGITEHSLTHTVFLVMPLYLEYFCSFFHLHYSFWHMQYWVRTSANRKILHCVSCQIWDSEHLNLLVLCYLMSLGSSFNYYSETRHNIILKKINWNRCLTHNEFYTHSSKIPYATIPCFMHIPFTDFHFDAQQ